MKTRSQILWRLFILLPLLASCEKKLPTPGRAAGGGSTGGSEVGNGGDPEYIIVAHGHQFAVLMLERINAPRVPLSLKSLYSQTEIDRFFAKKDRIAQALKGAKVTWVDVLPDFCRDHTVACAHAASQTIYFEKKSAHRFRNFRDAAAHLIHEGSHLIGETGETRANQFAVIALSTWEAMGHPSTPHWQSLPDSPLTAERIDQDPDLLRLQYSDWSTGKFYVWDERAVQSFDPFLGKWDLRKIPANPFQWKRTKGTYAYRSHYANWVNGYGIISVACRHQYPALKENHAAAVKLKGADLTWEPVTSLGAPADRQRIGQIKTETHLIVWGGESCSNTPNNFNDGGIYDPVADRWEAIRNDSPQTPTPRHGHSMLWTGTQLVVWGGFSVYQSPGHAGVAQVVNDGGIYNPKTKEWVTIPVDENTPSPRLNAHLVWSGNELIVFGGRDSHHQRGINTGGIYNPVKKSWRKLSVPRGDFAFGPYDVGYAFWSGSQMGVVSPKNFAFYDPKTDSWSEYGRPSFGEYPGYAKFFWTGLEGLLWNSTERKGSLLYP